MESLLYLIACFVFAFFTGGIAESKGRSTLGWFILGFLFPILAMIAVGLMPNLKNLPDKPTPKTHVKCPDCKELVLRDARKCKHCGTALIPDTNN